MTVLLTVAFYVVTVGAFAWLAWDSGPVFAWRCRRAELRRLPRVVVNAVRRDPSPVPRIGRAADRDRNEVA